MDKCRICLKCNKKMQSIYESENGITYTEMITSLTNVKILKENMFPNQICASCRKKLREAYNFKEYIKRSEMLINENGSLKRISFNNINDIKIVLDIDFKPMVPILCNFVEEFLENEVTDIKYKETTIKKIANVNNIQQTQISVKEFLDSVKIESNEDYCDQDYEVHEYDSTNSDSDYIHGKPLKMTKKRKTKRKNLNTGRRKFNKNSLNNPIKPVYLKDVMITHYDVKTADQPKRKYKYPAKRSVCPYCGKLLIEKSLNIHMLNKHSNVKPYKCDQCLKAFTTEKSLSIHKKIHVATEKFKCNQCIANFTMKSALQSHMKVHNEDKNFVCNICNKAFKRNSALHRHTLIHNFGKKSIQCELCPMTFHSKDFLKHHMRVHTGERPYKCEICSQPYSYKHDFNRHCLKKHGVFLKRRSVNVMNEEVLQQERALLKNLTLRAHGVIKDDNIPSVFEGPQGVRAFQQIMKAIEARQIPVPYVDTTYRI